jgi:hypothetical protein
MAAYGRHLGFFENFKVVGFSPCRSEVVHQISRRSVKRFNGYGDYKKPRWLPAYGRHL